MVSGPAENAVFTSKREYRHLLSVDGRENASGRITSEADDICLLGLMGRLERMTSRNLWVA